uniref:Uncharacterized protein n=1 Tax=Arundo donax TaxID=35708 RepID=A0A0A9GCW4_ARUDO
MVLRRAKKPRKAMRVRASNPLIDDHMFFEPTVLDAPMMSKPCAASLL